MYRSHSTQGRSGISVLARFMGDQATDGGTCSPLLGCWYKRPDRMLNKTRGMQPEVRLCLSAIDYVSKLGMVFEKELGVVESWSSTLRIGNPVRSDLVFQYMAFTTGEQKQAGVLVKQAPTILRSHPAQILLPMRTQLQITTSDVGRITLARAIAVFTVVFRTTKRGAELTATLIQRILRLPNKSGLMFNFQYGKTQRDEADHILTVPYDEEYLAICPVRAVTQLIYISIRVLDGTWQEGTCFLRFPVGGTVRRSGVLYPSRQRRCPPH